MNGQNGANQSSNHCISCNWLLARSYSDTYCYGSDCWSKHNWMERSRQNNIHRTIANPIRDWSCHTIRPKRRRSRPVIKKGDRRCVSESDVPVGAVGVVDLVFGFKKPLKSQVHYELLLSGNTGGKVSQSGVLLRLKYCRN